ncbi:MAG: tyrosine-type recombinase/integrase [Candidatus Aenigmarchaeota archaeon]|nr:tyrosine-type recombinase/integrase [Candidatus Aenigmarchaeota archaeon]
MASNDIYNNRQRYEYLKGHFEDLAEPPKRIRVKGKVGKYYSKNPQNIKYFYKLCDTFEARDLSYVRRCRLLGMLRLICYSTTKELSECDRDDINEIVRYMHTVCPSPISKADFIKGMKYIWKILFPETDSSGRVDETICPYPVRHLKAKIDKSREKRRTDKLTVDELERLIQFFSDDPSTQAYIALAVDSLGRPQEILYTKISDIELYENYARIWISEHGKEGTGFLQCIDSYPYFVRWLNLHPFKDKPGAFIFLNKQRERLTPFAVNKKIGKACNVLRINKPITCYSLKRSGVTIKRLLGYSDVEIQHTARWTSTRQLHIYDLSDQDDTFKLQLVKRGLVRDEKLKGFEPKTKICRYCNAVNGTTDEVCRNCKRPLELRRIRGQIANENEKNVKLVQLFKELLEENPELVEGMAKKVGLLN